MRAAGFKKPQALVQRMNEYLPRPVKNTQFWWNWSVVCAWTQPCELPGREMTNLIIDTRRRGGGNITVMFCKKTGGQLIQDMNARLITSAPCRKWRCWCAYCLDEWWHTSDTAIAFNCSLRRRPIIIRNYYIVTDWIKHCQATAPKHVPTSNNRRSAVSMQCPVNTFPLKHVTTIVNLLL
jgi:hypothetical protein